MLNRLVDGRWLIHGLACDRGRSRGTADNFKRILLARPSVAEKGPGGFFVGQVAQLVEHSTENRGVGGSIPPLATRVLFFGSSETIEVRSSIGRAPVSKTGGWGFESLRACLKRLGSRPHRLTVRTPGFQPGDRGSIPREGIIESWKGL